ncbi:nuclear receptor ROR-alpha A-like [Saccostrea cucullata]|uniref:nuclear receptor ROR-alpha A-like n=1 Tax=Saccostrea cuccullata TaxID=36930 RepID=UPI002ED66294
MHIMETTNTEKPPTSIETQEGTKKKGRKREKYIPSSEPLELPFCRICGKRASGIHFGVYSCEACKAFFRRCLQRTTPYKCDKGGDCVIDEQQKGLNCSACRLKKCLDLGMSKEGIRQGRYTVAERTNVIMEVKKLQENGVLQHKNRQNNLSSVSSNRHPVLSEHTYASDSSLHFSPDVARSDEVFTPPNCSSSIPPGSSPSPSCSSIYSNCSVVVDGTACVIDFTEEVSRHAITQTPIEQTLFCGSAPVSGQQEAKRIMENIMVGYGALKPFETTLNDQELEELFEEGYKKYKEKTRLFGDMNFLPADEYTEIYEKTNMDVDGRLKILQDGRRDMVRIVREYVQFTQGVPDFRALSPKDQATLLKASRFEFFVILQYRSIDFEREIIVTYTGQARHFSEICVYTPIEVFRNWFEFMKKVKELNFTPEEHALVLAISLTFRDRCSLEEPDKVEKIQTTLIETLGNLLEETHGNSGGRRLAKIMDLFIRLRALGEEYLQLYKNLCKDKFLIKVIPEMLQFLFDE